MNKYHAIFNFNREWVAFQFNANQLANTVLDKTDHIADFHFNNEGQSLDINQRINGSVYNIVFALHNPKCVSVYETYENGGDLIQENIPWLLLQVEGPNGEILYDINAK